MLEPGKVSIPRSTERPSWSLSTVPFAVQTRRWRGRRVTCIGTFDDAMLKSSQSFSGHLKEKDALEAGDHLLLGGKTCPPKAVRTLLPGHNVTIMGQVLGLTWTSLSISRSMQPRAAACPSLITEYLQLRRRPPQAHSVPAERLDAIQSTHDTVGLDGWQILVLD